MKTIVKTNQAPAPIGPYNQAVKHGETVFVSGQIAIDPATGKLEQDSIEAETHLVLTNLKAVLEAAGTNLEAVVKCSIFVTDMNDFNTVNTVYGQYFTVNHPARETVQVSALPAGARVEISCIAIG